MFHTAISTIGLASVGARRRSPLSQSDSDARQRSPMRSTERQNARNAPWSVGLPFCAEGNDAKRPSHASAAPDEAGAIHAPITITAKKNCLNAAHLVDEEAPAWP